MTDVSSLSRVVGALFIEIQFSFRFAGHIQVDFVPNAVSPLLSVAVVVISTTDTIALCLAAVTALAFPSNDPVQFVSPNFESCLNTLPLIPLPPSPMSEQAPLPLSTPTPSPSEVQAKLGDFSLKALGATVLLLLLILLLLLFGQAPSLSPPDSIPFPFPLPLPLPLPIPFPLSIPVPNTAPLPDTALPLPPPSPGGPSALKVNFDEIRNGVPCICVSTHSLFGL